MAEVLDARQEAYREWELRMVEQTLNMIYKIMARAKRFRNFPNEYLVIDVETSGVQFGLDLILGVGYSLVIDRKEVDRGNFVLDWTRHPRVDQRWLRQRIVECKQNVEWKHGKPTGRTYQFSYERLRQDGSDPLEVLREYLALLNDIRDDGQFFVAHNGYHFDVRLLQEHFDTFLKQTFKLDDNELIDTGMIEKGSRASMIPWEGDSVRTWSERVYKQWLKGVSWALDKHCIPYYGIDKKYNIDLSQAHDAGFDCWMTHLLLEHWRDLTEAAYRTDSTKEEFVKKGLYQDGYWKDLVDATNHSRV